MIWVAAILWCLLAIACALAPAALILAAGWIARRIRKDEP